MFKIAVAVVALGVAGLLAVVVTSHFAINIANYELQKISGFSLTAEQHDINPFAGATDLQGLQVSNPASFPAPDFVRCKEIKTQISLFSMLSSRIVIDEVLVDVDAATVVQTKEGDFNLLALARAFPNDSKASTPAKPGTKTLPTFIIKKLTLRINDARYLDFNHGGGKPQVVKIGYDRTFTDVTDSNLSDTEIAIATDISGKGAVFLAQGFANAVLDPALYTDTLKNTLNLGTQLVQGAGKAVGGAADAATGVVGGAASAVGNLLNFGK